MGHKEAINWLSFSPNSQYLLTASEDSTIKLWNPKGQLITTFKSDLFPISRVKFSPNGQYFMTASQDGTIRLWDDQGKLHTKMKGHQESIESVQFTPDNQTLLTVARDGKVKIWPVESEFARLSSLLNQGCQWLEDYFVTRLPEQEKLSSCFPKMSPKNP